MQPWIDKAVRIVVEHYAPDQILLFGSCARGDSTQGSDVDLLIVKDTDLPRAYRGLEVINHLKRYPIKYDLLFYTSGELENGKRTENSFLHSILKKGKILYQKMGY